MRDPCGPGWKSRQRGDASRKFCALLGTHSASSWRPLFFLNPCQQTQCREAASGPRVHRAAEALTRKGSLVARVVCMRGRLWVLRKGHMSENVLHRGQIRILTHAKALCTNVQHRGLEMQRLAQPSHEAPQPSPHPGHASRDGGCTPSR